MASLLSLDTNTQTSMFKPTNKPPCFPFSALLLFSSLLRKRNIPIPFTRQVKTQFRVVYSLRLPAPPVHASTSSICPLHALSNVCTHCTAPIILLLIICLGKALSSPQISLLIQTQISVSRPRAHTHTHTPTCFRFSLSCHRY